MLHHFNQIQQTPRHWSRFGWTVGIILVVLGLGLGWRIGPVYLWLAGAGLALVILGWAMPRLLRWPYLIWMGIGLVLGTVVSTVFLTVFFFLVLTPMGMLARLMGKDFLSRRLKPQARSYWLARTEPGPKEPRRFEEQF